MQVFNDNLFSIAARSTPHMNQLFSLLLCLTLYGYSTKIVNPLWEKNGLTQASQILKVFDTPNVKKKGKKKF